MPETRNTWIKTTPLIALLPVLALAISGCSGSDPGSAGASGPSGDSAAGTPNGGGNGDDGGSTTVGPGAPGNDAGPVTPIVDAGGGTSTDAAITALPGWKLVWNDEFDLPNGSAADGTKWTNETGNSGWSNNRELQFYTPGTTNAVIQGGSLVITAASQGASAYKCQYGTCQYTSARLNTSGKFQQQYGRFEARIKLPRGQGIWPAWWILGTNIGSVGWPKCGEVDIMENVGKTPSTNYGSLHGPGYSGGHPLTGSYLLPGATLADDFHVYAIEWAANVVRFYFDSVNYETRTPADVPAGSVWVYDHPFYLILNLAVGGSFPGNPDGTSTFPQTMTVDYVRVYSPSP